MHRKQLIEEFCSAIKGDFNAYCEQFERENNRDHFITFLIDYELISSKKIKDYTIIKTFDATNSADKSKTQVVRELAQRFNLSTRSLWSILQKKRK